MKSRLLHDSSVSKKSAVIQLIDFLESVSLENSTNFHTVYLDYAKAFDRVPFQVLLRKLCLFGLDESFICLFESNLTDRYQIFIVQNEVTDPMPVFNCVPQGSISGPFLFFIFLNDMPSKFQMCLKKRGLAWWRISVSQQLTFWDENHQKGFEFKTCLDPKWTYHGSAKFSKAQKLYFLLRNTVPRRTPPSVKFNIYSNTVIFVIMCGSAVCLANFCFLKKTETFRKGESFGFSDQEQLMNNSSSSILIF